MSRLFFLAFAALALTLTACSSTSVSPRNCKDLNWKEIGYQTAMDQREINSYSPELGSFIEKCKREYGITEDKSELYTGYIQGQTEFCTYEQGHKMGSSGDLPSPICSKKDHGNYHRGYQKGVRYFCTYQGGYDFGLKGGDYMNNCPAGREKAFLRGLNKGRSELLGEKQSTLEETVEEDIVSEDLDESDVRTMDE